MNDKKDTGITPEERADLYSSMARIFAGAIERGENGLKETERMAQDYSNLETFNFKPKERRQIL